MISAKDATIALQQVHDVMAHNGAVCSCDKSPKRILPMRLSRDDMAELRLWWDWKQLPDDVKSEMLPPPSPSELTQGFMDTNHAWRFDQDGTLIAGLDWRTSTLISEEKWIAGRGWEQVYPAFTFNTTEQAVFAALIAILLPISLIILWFPR